MDGEPSATRREHDQLARVVARIDEEGTRGMASVAASVDRLSEAVTQLRSESVTRWGEHSRQHRREARERASARHWRITTTIAATAAAATFLGLLVAILNTLAARGH